MRCDDESHSHCPRIGDDAYPSPLAQTVLKEEPKRNLLKHGQVVLVDDGSCPAGEIKEVTGGKDDAAKQVRRTRRCVPKT